MKKHILLIASLFFLCAGSAAYAQAGKTLKKKTINSKAIASSDSKADELKRPGNEKNKPVAEVKSRGDVYGANYSDVIIDNWTGYYLDIYVNGNFRGTVSPWDKRVTWAIPGTNTLYAKAVFNDGSYIYWGPVATYTGYQYTWKLTN